MPNACKKYTELMEMNFGRFREIAERGSSLQKLTKAKGDIGSKENKLQKDLHRDLNSEAIMIHKDIFLEQSTCCVCKEVDSFLFSANKR